MDEHYRLCFVTFEKGFKLLREQESQRVNEAMMMTMTEIHSVIYLTETLTTVQNHPSIAAYKYSDK